MKSILMSIQPKWVVKILNGEKTIEVRKTAPKEVPFKVYIYCTYGGGRKGSEALYFDAYGNVSRKANGVKWINGKVIGEFVCDKVICLTYETKIPTVKQNEDGTLSIVGYTTTEPFYNGKLSTIKGSCLEQKQLLSYGKGKTLYGLHITALKVYDKPRELGEFRKPDTSCGFYNPDLERCDSGYNCERCVYNDLTITRPPQSWQYVGEIEE